MAADTPARKRRGAVVYHVAMVLLVAVWLIPLIWTLSLSLTPNAMLQVDSQHLFPQALTLSNYADVFRTGLTGRWFLNSMIVTIITTIITVFVCATAGYAFAKLTFPGRMVVYALTLAGMMGLFTDRGGLLGRV